LGGHEISLVQLTKIH